MPEAFSELLGRNVDTHSGAWRHECEVRHLVDKMKPGDLKLFLEGGEGERGILQARGAAAVEHLRSEMARVVEARRARKA